jgi:hypothetical protein
MLKWRTLAFDITSLLQDITPSPSRGYGKWGTVPVRAVALVMPVMGDVGGCTVIIICSILDLHAPTISTFRPYSGADTSTVPSSSELTLATVTRIYDLACYIYIEALVNVL